MAKNPSLSAAAAEPSGRGRAISAGEFLLGAVVVLGHNVFHRLPNEVPILVLLAIISMRWRQGSWNWSSLGFKRPRSWTRLLIIAATAAAIRLLLGALVIEPLTAHFWPAIKAPSGSAEIQGHLSVALASLAIVWVFAGLGEEIGYRGYLLNKLAEVFGPGRTADVVAVLGSAVLFGFGHYYKGPAGVLDSGIAGAILGVTYLISGRNLWASVLAHGFIDTVAVTWAYLGWDS